MPILLPAGLLFPAVLDRRLLFIYSAPVNVFLFYLTPLYKFFYKKSIVQDFLMYNEFATTITKESDPVR